MDRLWRYYRSYQSVRGDVGGLPAWARTVLLIAAAPAVAAILLSVLAFLVSLLALLLLTVPLYRLLRMMTGGEQATVSAVVESVDAADGPVFDDLGSPGRKRVDATVVSPADQSEQQTEQSEP